MADLMKRFHLAQFLYLAKMLRGGLTLDPRTASASIPDEIREAGLSVLPVVLTDCKALAFRGSSASMERVIRLLNKPEATYGQFNSEMNDFLSRSADEMLETYFLALSLAEEEGYAEPWKAWDAVVLDRFPEAHEDIIEAGRCLALGRDTAGVFHLMRIMEVGLRRIGKALLPNLDPSTNPSWEAILKKSDDEIKKRREDRDPDWQKKEAFYTEANAHLRAVCRAWRNPVMHVEKTYGSEHAREIFNAVRGFMRHLSAEL